VPIRGNSLAAAASWGGGNVSSLSSLEGVLVSVAVAMVDIGLGCTLALYHRSSTSHRMH
jgi:hypothetical protein